MFRTPLTATLSVILGMLLLMIPLHRLTRASHIPASPPQNQTDDTHAINTWASLRLLADAKSVTIQTPDGLTLWASESLKAGEHEFRMKLKSLDEPTECILEITFENQTLETAAFLTLSPDGTHELTCYAIGRGHIHELLPFSWRDH